MASLGDVLGGSPAILGVRKQVDRLLRQVAARRPPPVLIQGETGTGKGLLAREMHRAGPRPHGPFVAINCAAIPEPLLEAELFGFERGAFTDARQPKPGLLRAAHGGTLLLDEIGLLSPAVQGKLLTVIEERRVRRLGSTQSEPVDVWIMAATNTDLTQATRRGTFRQDLYHRLAVLTLALPPLRERGDDVILLAERFLARACADYGLPTKTLDPDTGAALLAYSWPGNIRELANVIERAALLEEASRITSSMLQLPTSRTGGPGDPESTTPELPNLGDSVRELERGRLLETLAQTRWNVSQTAIRLGITRNQVRYRIEKYGLRPRAGGARQGRSPAAPGTTPAAVEAVARDPVTVAPRWERRHLAFLAAALVLPERREDATVTSGVLASHVEKLVGFGGAVEEVGPHRVVVAFGLEPIEDAPVRAALAALAIRKAAERAGLLEPGEAAITIAVHVAPALVGGLGGTPRVDLDGRRGAVEVLERLLARAEPGITLVSHAAAPFLARRFEMVRLDPGEAGTPCFVLVGRERSGFGLEGRPLSPFVGRGREVEAVEPLLAQVERGRGQLLGVVGEPGVGKSRFVFELTRSERVRTWRVLGCGAVSYGTATAYLPILDLLRSYFELDESQPRAQLHDRVVEKVRALDAELEVHLPALLALLDLPVDDPTWHDLDPAHQRWRRLEAVKRLLLRESQIRPLLLVVEDLHWSDSETRAVLEALEESLPAARVLLLVTYRPGYRHDWGSRSYYTQLRLDPLTPAGTGELLRQLLGDDDSLRPLTELIAERTEGNALFLEETVRMLVEARVLVGESGAYRLAGPTETITVPDTVQALLAVRIDRLPPGDKTLLQTASVIGHDVPLALLRATDKSAPGELAAAISRLQAAEFLYEVTLAGDQCYTFKHALTHEVAYRSLPDAQRCALHARLVEVIRTVYADRLSEQTDDLARHAFHGEQWDEALALSRQVGDRAAARCALREAAAAFEQALVALDHLPRNRDAVALAIDLRFELRNVLQPLGEDSRILSHLQVAERLAVELDDRARLGRVLVYRSTLLWVNGEPESAIARATAGLEIATAVGDAGLEAMAMVHLGAPHHAVGEHRRAVVFLERAIDLSGGERLHQRMGLSNIASVLARSWLVRCLAELGEFEEGIRRGEEAVQIADSAGHLISQQSAHQALGFLYLRRGDLERALPRLEAAMELDRRGHSSWIWIVGSALGYAYLLAGRLDDAFRFLEQKGIWRLGAPLRVAWLAEAHLVAGRPEQAILLAGEARRLARDHHERGHEAWVQRLQGEIALARDPLDDELAEQAFQQARNLASELQMRPLVAHCHLGLGRLDRLRGRRDTAREHLEAALAQFLSMGMPLGSSRAEAELATLEQRQT